MNNQSDSDKPLLSALDRWQNICDAMAETMAECSDALREDFPPTTPQTALFIKLELAHLARPDESPEEHISRLKQETKNLIVDRAPALGDIAAYARESLEEYISRFMQTRGRSLPWLIAEVETYVDRISELEKAAGHPPTIKREPSTNSETPTPESSKKPL